MAVNAQELRIGNWIAYRESKYPFQVTDIADGNVNLMYSEGGGHTWCYDLDECVGIDLTPTILELCGCKLQAMRQSIYVIGRLKIWLGHTGILCYLKNEDDNGSCYIPNGGIRFLHQFQNHYYSLTGTELTIQPITHGK